MKTRNKFTYLILILLSSILWNRCQFIANEIKTDLTDVTSSFDYDANRVHKPLKSDLDSDNSIITAGNNTSFEVNIFSLDSNRPNCIVNSIGTKEFKIIEIKPGTYGLRYGVNQDDPEPSDGNLYPIGIVIEDKHKEYLNAYKFRYADDIEGRINLVEAIPYNNNSPNINSNLDSAVFSEKGSAISSVRTRSFFGKKVIISIPKGEMKTCNNDNITLGKEEKRNVEAWVTLVSEEANKSSITNNSTFPIPVIASQFKARANGTVIDYARVGTFNDATYIGLDILGEMTKEKGSILEGNEDDLIEVKIKLDYLINDSREVWRFYQNCDTKEYIWEKIESEVVSVTDGGISINYLRFFTDLSLGWVICTNTAPYCDVLSPENSEFPLYAKIKLNHNNTDIATAENIYTGKLFDANDNLIPASIIFNKDIISIYGVPDISTKLKIYRKKLNGVELIDIIDLMCGSTGTEPPQALPFIAITRLYVDVRYAYCSASSFPFTHERSLEVFACNSTTCPDEFNTCWAEIDYLKDGILETYLLEKGKSYCFMVAASQYKNKTQQLHRSIVLEDEGIKPTKTPVPAYASDTTGILICTETGGNYDCSFTLDNTIAVDSLYKSNYCNF